MLCFALRAFNAVDLIVLLAEFSRESQTESFCACDRWGTPRCEDDAGDGSTRKWRSIAPLPIMPKPAAKLPQPIPTLPLQLGS